MANALKSAKVKTSKKKKDVPQPVPIEKRSDVTVDELERLSLPYPAELYNGKVMYKMANLAHGIIQSLIGARISIYLEKNRIGYAMSETNFRLWQDRPRESRIPDIAFIKKERLPEDLYRFPALAPDLAVEIISPDDSFFKVMEKVDEYLSAGTQLVWLVIPNTREVLVCTAERKYSVRDSLTAPGLLPGFELPVDEIFEALPAPAKF